MFLVILLLKMGLKTYQLGIVCLCVCACACVTFECSVYKDVHVFMCVVNASVWNCYNLHSLIVHLVR